jgi:hypothetical protein
MHLFKMIIKNYVFICCPQPSIHSSSLPASHPSIHPSIHSASQPVSQPVSQPACLWDLTLRPFDLQAGAPNKLTTRADRRRGLNILLRYFSCDDAGADFRGLFLLPLAAFLKLVCHCLAFACVLQNSLRRLGTS